jgi:lipoate-protein ligase A
MALDEALLDQYVGDGGAGRAPTVRLYGWRPGALSLGKFQSTPAPDVLDRLRAAGLDLVRRPTGGGAVLHEQERTYAVAGRLGESGFPRDVLGTYRRIAAVLVRAYALLGVSVVDAPATARSLGDGVSCFESASAHEIQWCGRKLAGSAQRRRGRAFLQHGSLPLRLAPERLAAILGREADRTRFADASTAAGRDVSPAELDAALITAFAEALGPEVVRSSWSAGGPVLEAPLAGEREDRSAESSRVRARD